MRQAISATSSIKDLKRIFIRQGDRDFLVRAAAKNLEKSLSQTSPVLVGIAAY
jgi:hypothetical protein